MEKLFTKGTTHVVIFYAAIQKRWSSKIVIQKRINALCCFMYRNLILLLYGFSEDYINLQNLKNPILSLRCLCKNLAIYYKNRSLFNTDFLFALMFINENNVRKKKSISVLSLFL